MGLTITPLLVGWIRGMPKPAITYGFNWGERHDSAVLTFLIEGGDSPVIVDTGTLGPDSVAEHHGYTLDRPVDLEPSTVISEAGIELGDVKHVINTHLHWDHCSNNTLFTEASFYIQSSELAYAADPLPWHKIAYDKKNGIKPPWLAVWDRIETVHGDAEIVPGVSVITVPGHTPGSQAVVVQTDTGAHLLTGDLIDTYENWEGNDVVPHIPSGVHTDLFAYHASFKRVEELGATVVPSHDGEVLARGPFGVKA